MASGPAQIVNEATVLIGGFNDNLPITGTPPNFDGSAIGIEAGQIYYDTVAEVSRQFGFDFSRSTVALVPTGNVAPFPWPYEYGYPASCIQLRQVMPTTLADPNNPMPVDWTVGNVPGTALTPGVPLKVIWSDTSPAQAIISNTPPEALWDGIFTQAVVRALAAKLAMGTAGRPDLAREYLENAEQYEKIGETREDT
jgi:hypothetical protein